MTELHLIRHGQTDWNLQGRYQGQCDIALNRTGLEQARSLARQLAGQHFDALYSSDLQRASQTAQVLADALNLRVYLTADLREISMGAWEGRLVSDVSLDYAQDESPDNRAPGGESVAQVAARMARAAGEICRAHPAGSVLIVSHGLALAALVCLARRIPLEQVYEHIPDNASPAVILWE